MANKSKKVATKNVSRTRFAKAVQFIESRNGLFAIVVLLLLTLSAGSALYYRVKYIAAVQPNVHDYYGFKVWQPDDIVESKDIAFSFNGVRTDATSVPQYWELEPGQRYVIVDISFKNKTNKPYELSPIMSMVLRDDAGNEYKVTSAPAITRGLGGRVAVGETVRGDVGFTLPESVKKLTYEFTPYISSSAPIQVDFTVQ